jgi:hypothetical protein
MNNKEQFLKELEEIKRDYTEHDWDGYGALPLNKTSAEFAEKFIHEVIELYPSLPYPELAVLPDGDLGFNWAKDGTQLVMSIDSYSKIYYALRREDGTSETGNTLYESDGELAILFIPFEELLRE